MPVVSGDYSPITSGALRSVRVGAIIAKGKCSAWDLFIYLYTTQEEEDEEEERKGISTHTSRREEAKSYVSVVAGTKERSLHLASSSSMVLDFNCYFKVVPHKSPEWS